MVLINKLKKRECEAPAGGIKRDNLNEPVAANTELERGDNNQRSGTKFFLLASAVTVNHLSALCGVLVKFIQP